MYRVFFDQFFYYIISNELLYRLLLMLLYSENLYNHIVDIIPLLIISDNFEIKGSFKRKTPYITDVDIVNDAYPQVNKESIRKHLVKLIDSLKKHPEIILVNITCGVDERFVLETGSDEEIKNVEQLLTDEEQNAIDMLRIKYANDRDRFIFYAKQSLKHLRKLRWLPDEIISNEKIVRGDNMINFNRMVYQNKSLLIKYAIPVEGYMVGFDVAVYYDKINPLVEIYELAAERHLLYAAYHREYYNLLFHLKRHLFMDIDLRKQITDITERRLGIYKQLLARTEIYQDLYNYGYLTLTIAKAMLVKFVQDVPKLKGFKTNTIYQIKKVAQNPELTPEAKIEAWTIIIDVLRSEVYQEVNILAEPYYYKYVELIPIEVRKKYCAADELDRCLQNN